MYNVYVTFKKLNTPLISPEILGLMFSCPELLLHKYSKY